MPVERRASAATSGTTQVPAEEIRVGDVDRERAVRRLCAAAGEGRLTLAEAGDRQASAYAARFPHELAALLADLPPEVPDAAPVATECPGGGLRDALRTLLVINGIAVSVGLSTVPGAAALVALLSGITIIIVMVAAEGVAGLYGRQRPDRPRRRRSSHDR
jgi:Domain of unknown function (DUF1707)